MAQSHCSLLVHVVFSTKDRAKDLDADLCPRLFGYIATVIDSKGAKAHMVGGGLEHVHVLFTLPASVTLADIVRAVKSNSSRWVHETFPKKRHFGWQAGYAAFSVSHSKFAEVYAYVRDQEDHHRRHAFEDELISLLKRNDVEYDERYLWS